LQQILSIVPHYSYSKCAFAVIAACCTLLFTAAMLTLSKKVPFVSVAFVFWRLHFVCYCACLRLAVVFFDHLYFRFLLVHFFAVISLHPALLHDIDPKDGSTILHAAGSNPLPCRS
jgi:hypothetical protein